MGPNTQNQSSGSAEPRVPTNPSANVHVGQQPIQPVSQPVQQPAVPAVSAEQPAAPPSESQAKTTPVAKSNLMLPKEIISRTHLSRCLRELQKIDDFFHQASIKGSNNQLLPDISRELEGLMKTNGLNVLQAEDRDKVKSFLANLKTKAPVVHMSFPSEAGTAFLTKLLDWYRREAHPYTVLHVGLQPELAAGCIVRTTNKYHDFSFRKRFEKSKSKLIEQLELTGKQVADEMKSEVAAAAQAVPAASVPTAAPAPSPVPSPAVAAPTPLPASPQPGEST